MRIQLKQRKLLGALCSALLLSACGGGGGSDSPTSTSVSGVASKGIIANGLVEGYKIENGLVGTTPVATTTTDANGNYTLNIPGYTGPVKVVIKNNPAATTTVKCDAPSGCAGGVAYGATMPMNFEMAAIVPEVSGGAVSVSITPFSHMAATLAQNGALDKANIDMANKKVAELFDLSGGLLATKPLDVTDKAKVQAAATGAQSDALKLAFMSAAIAELANTKAGGDIGQMLSSLATQYANNNGELLQNSGTASNITVANITTATLTVVNKYETANDDNLSDALVEDGVSNQQTAANNAAPETKTTTTLIISDTQVADAIAKAKGVVTTLRTWSTQLATLDDASTIFSDEIDTARKASALGGELVGQGLAFAAEAAGRAYQASVDQASPLGIAGRTITTANGVEVQFNCNGTYSDNQGGGGEYIVSGNNIYLEDRLQGNAVRVTSSTATVGVSTGLSVADIYGGTDSDSVAAVTTNATCSASPALAEWVFNSKVTAVSGNVAVSGTSVTVNGTFTPVNGQPVTVDTTFTMPVTTTAAAYNVAVKGTVELPNRATLTIKDTSKAQIGFLSSVALLDPLAVFPAVGSASFKLDAEIAQGTKSDTGATVTDPVSYSGVIDASGILPAGAAQSYFNPSSMTMNGSFSSQSGKSFAAEFKATMANASTFKPNYSPGYNSDGESSASWRQVAASLTLEAKALKDALNGTVPDAKLTIDVTRTGLNSATGTVSIRYGAIAITASATGNGETQQGSGSVVVTDSSNVDAPVQLVLVPSADYRSAKGSVKVGSTVVGSISQATSGALMNYVDGSFETVVL